MASAYAKWLIEELRAHGGLIVEIEPGVFYHQHADDVNRRVQGGEVGRMERAGLLTQIDDDVCPAWTMSSGLQLFNGLASASDEEITDDNLEAATHHWLNMIFPSMVVIIHSTDE